MAKEERFLLIDFTADDEGEGRSWPSAAGATKAEIEEHIDDVYPDPSERTLSVVPVRALMRVEVGEKPKVFAPVKFLAV